MSIEPQSSPTLCLNMIVKNESKIITRLFDSVLPVIDSYCICDTGSTDNTVELITDYFKSKNIPGKVVVEPFKNFCHNRNFALTSCIGMSDFVLLLDADMILETKNFNKNMLNMADQFHILQGCDAFYYQNMRIVKNNGLYSYSGVTHEYINTPSNSHTHSFGKNEIFIKDIGDGGAKHDKFERDIKLLLDGIKEAITNMGKNPQMLCTDDEGSFHSKEANQFCKDNHIKHIITRGHADYVGRATRTIKI